MHIFIKRSRIIFLLLLLVLAGGFFRFYNLNWGSPFYFHPDERNIASSVIGISFPSQMNPKFFAYGSLPIYAIYFTNYLVSIFTKSSFPFEQAIIISRFYSAILSLFLIPSLFFVGYKLFNKTVGIISAIFITFSTGLIQFAHFGTFEIWLTFFTLWLFYFSFVLIKKLEVKTIVVVSILYGILMSIKISSFPLLTIPLIAILLNRIEIVKVKSIKNIFLSSFFKLLIIIFISLIIFAISSPYIFLDFISFKSSISYESTVALGTLSVFYTGEFFDSIPIFFQFKKIYPFIINPFFTILFAIFFLYILINYFKKKNIYCLFLIMSFLLIFLSQAFLFVKWTRYMIPTLPFVYLILSIGITDFLKRESLIIWRLTLIFLIIINIIFSSSYFLTVLAGKDSRIEASIFAKENIEGQSNILSEAYDMGIVPFNQYFSNISLFNFYDLELDPKVKPLELKNILLETDYIILPSQRILKTRLTNKEKFPYGNKFYKDLLSGSMGYEKIYETPCNIFCKISYFGDPVFSPEQTVNVFDRPTIYIFKKIL